MKKILPLLLFTILTLTACTETTDNTKNKVTDNKTTNYNYEFIGESEHWEAEYIYQGTETTRKNDKGVISYSNKDNYELVLKFKGSLKELSSMKKLEYSFKTNSSSGESKAEFPEPPKERVFTSRGSSEGGAKVDKDEVIQVHVKWNESEESFELHNKKK
ncbi:hypothetical protein CN692_20015 [Bacillus sp. AFS002410]|uniref:hypothetical protein n=1 Tax=Bacillus sp. AFS002410 TaxID=2033481 RepID=UPI000BF1B7B4|nr:hypothetical protein [Bacillus sp. AFS002410]PEJ54385.1 hypothetical protein CN692_20015 [Bacillus sp. AFS002410]